MNEENINMNELNGLRLSPHFTLGDDLEASGFPGMTNAFHFYAFAKCVIWIDEISFSEAVAPVPAAPLDGMTLPETGKAWELPIKDYLAELE